MADLPRLAESLARRRDRTMVLIGRRQLRSNNSWMHNLEPLVKGKERCTAQVHPDDAARLGLAEGAAAVLRSAAGRVEAPVEVTDSVMPGVVSLPHGWGHDQPGVRMAVASAHAGVNSNVLADETRRRPAVRQRRAQRHPGRRVRRLDRAATAGVRSIASKYWTRSSEPLRATRLRSGGTPDLRRATTELCKDAGRP